jgi:phosphatidylserine/phosphatidylglycerophosphate/cardiolipin synthase-like enzyme
VAIGELARERWHRSGGPKIQSVAHGTDCWPTALDAQFSSIDVGIARTCPKMGDNSGVFEVERLYLDLIRTAKRFIYAESQYFASRRIAQAIACRLAEPDGPEIVLINPQSAEGWLEPIAMDSARARLREALRNADPHARFRIYHPVTEGGQPIYVHAKILIIDDRVLRVGSSNMNNRSLRLDTECDVAIDGGLPANDGCRLAIDAVRNGLLAEHLGCKPEEIERQIGETGSLIASIERMRGKGRSLIPYETPDLTSVERWLADNEVLDPEDVDELFEPLTKRGLFRHFRRLRAT